MAATGQTAPQCPQPIHQSPRTTEAFLSRISKTKPGQASTQMPHPVHRAVNTSGGDYVLLIAFYPPYFTIFAYLPFTSLCIVERVMIIRL